MTWSVRRQGVISASKNRGLEPGRLALVPLGPLRVVPQSSEEQKHEPELLKSHYLWPHWFHRIIVPALLGCFKDQLS